MKRLLAALAIASAALAGCQTDATGPRPLAAGSAIPRAEVAAAPSVRGRIPGQYLVLLRRARAGASTEARSEPLGDSAGVTAEVTTVAQQKLAGGRGVLLRAFGHAVRGFSARLSDSAAAALRTDPDVITVEPDPVMSVSGGGGVEVSPPSWGLDRIDQAQLPLDGSYHYPNDGGVSVYILDTGINLGHTDFGGRAVTGVDFVTPGGSATDCYGHGTHVAGTVGGAAYGVAKHARLVAVRVLDCTGSGSGSNVIAGIDWVVQQKHANPATPMVINMSLGGGAAAVLDSAVASATGAGVTVVVAAGNAGADACTVSPARAPSAITVAATDISDTFASFSNSGSCVDIVAPGVNIPSDYIGSSTATATLSGTSMATPHVSGAAALYLAANPAATPAQVAAALTGAASTAHIRGLPANTPSRLLDIAFLNGGMPSPVQTTGTLTNAATGVCLTLPGSGPAPTALGAAACVAGSAAQQWTVSAIGTTGTLTAYAGSVCADDWGARGQAGDVIGGWSCNGQANQQWTLTADGELRGITGLCMAASGSAGAPTVTLQPCTAAAAQRWTFAPAAGGPAPTRFTSLLTNGASGMCLDVVGASQDAGAHTIVWPCHGRANQLWSLPLVGMAGEVRVYGARCLDDFGGGGHDGDAIGIWSCNGGANQQWTLTSTGQLRGINGKCVTITGTVTQNGAPVKLEPCGGGGAGMWLAPGAAPSAPTVSSTLVAAQKVVPPRGSGGA